MSDKYRTTLHLSDIGVNNTVTFDIRGGHVRCVLDGQAFYIPASKVGSLTAALEVVLRERDEYQSTACIDLSDVDPYP